MVTVQLKCHHQANNDNGELDHDCKPVVISDEMRDSFQQHIDIEYSANTRCFPGNLNAN